MSLYALLLAGGHGTRLWPISRKRTPKHLQPILGGDSMMRSTWKRLRQGLPAQRILVITNAEMAELIRRELPDLPEESLLIEPRKLGTAAAIGFGTAVALSRDPQASVVSINADAYVKQVKEYWRVIRLAERAARRAGRIVLVGLRPSYPETGYGYIKMGSHAMRLRRGHNTYDEVFEVEGFREKPDLETAKAYIAQWEYLWNPTLIVGEGRIVMRAFKQHLPKSWREFETIRKAWKTSRRMAALEKAFHRLAPISIEYDVLEKEKRMLVVPADFGWADVGHWRAVHEVLSKKPDANVTRGKHISHDSSGNLLYSFTGKLIATAGLKDMVIIETEDVVLVCPKDRAQDVKKLVEALEKKKMQKYL